MNAKQERRTEQQFVSRASFSLRWLSVLGLLLSLAGGCKPRQIVKPTPYMDSDPNQWIRVRLHTGLTEGYASAEQGFTVHGEGGPLGAFADIRSLHVTWGAGRLFLNEQPVDANAVTLIPADPYVLTWNDRPWRGRLAIQVRDSGLTVVNRVPLESYLAGVIGAEMPAYWEPEALRVQTVAARTYCLYVKERFGRQRDWDLSRSQAHQVYRGVAAESTQVWEAVEATRGQVLMVTHEKNERVLFPTYYSAICGGHTEASRYVFGNNGLSMRGVACPYCRQVAPMSLYYWPLADVTVDVANERLLARYPALQALERVVDVVVQETRPYPDLARVTRVQLIGVNGRTDTLRGEDFRLCLDPSGRRIKSTFFELQKDSQRWIFQNGQGWGHGVGLCQYGAQGLARQGKTAAEILAYYFPEAQLQCLDSN